MKHSSLVIYYGPSRVMEIPSVYSGIGIGSAHDNDIRLVGEGIRPYHLVIRRRGRTWYAVSRGGGLFRTERGKEARHVRLDPREKIWVGNYAFEIEAASRPGADGGESTASIASHVACPTEIRLSVCHPGAPGGEILTFSRGSISIGRDPSNQVVITDRTCSGFHALIEKTGEGWFIIDLGSKNGLYVDGRKVAGCRLHDGSTILAGKTPLLCGLDGAASQGSDYLQTEGLAPVLLTAGIYAGTDFPVLIHGESGTGKEMLAQFIHSHSSRSARPCIPVNCGAIPEALAESLLFGHRRGAFTGALETQEGFIGAADGGTLLLDEVGELPQSVQAKLLRMLDRGLFTEVGETRQRKVDVRIISATNSNLLDMVRQGKFREDLYHRLAVLNLELPPLRERPADIGPLSEWILGRLETTGGWSRCEGIGAPALEKLRSYWWPGNVRELRNVLQRASMKASGAAIRPEHIEFTQGLHTPGRLSPSDSQGLRDLMESCSWRIAAAARRAGLPRTTLRYRLKKSGIERNN